MDMKRLAVRAVDAMMSPATLLSSLLLKSIRTVGVQHLPVSRKIFDTKGTGPAIS